MRDRRWVRCGVVAAGLLWMGQSMPVEKNKGGEALKALAAHWAGLKDVRTLEARFVCEKRLAALDTPLESTGRVWIHKAEGVRFSTETPYISELILSGGKVYARSQHETEWTKTNQATRPGLTAVMSELGGWSTGDTARIGEMYSVATSEENVPAAPGGGEMAGNGPVDVFVLTPTNADLLKAVKHITLALDRGTNLLRYVAIETQQDDVTRYWFLDVKTNMALPADIFKAVEGGGGAQSIVPGEGK